MSDDAAQCAAKCRDVLLESVRAIWDEAIAAGCSREQVGIILSGGVDTCAVLAACVELDLRPSIAITCYVSELATDIPYAQGLAAQCAEWLVHHEVRVDAAGLVADALPVCTRVLGSFDGMQLRNSMVVQLALAKAQALGLKYVLTGDAADELLGGYSFTWNMDDASWFKHRAEMCAEWSFSAPELALNLGGLRARSPFMEAPFSEWALALSKAKCIGERPIELSPAGERLVHKTGKLPLRGAFPSALSAWRRKDPIEVGSGSDKLGKGWFESEEAIRVHGIFPAPLGTPLGDAIAAARVVPRDAECQANFGAFLAAYPAVGRGVDLPANGPTPARRLGHVGSCIECGYALSRPTAMFCRVCGAWPARHVAPPPAAAAAVAAAVEP